mmetsp:Transcript_87138/g.191449  ORF Transcript_87138/g.191449 Transcript_87138/m.191449 type:complete len:132 (+) Transcript_87138:2454-2849(+)
MLATFPGVPLRGMRAPFLRKGLAPALAPGADGDDVAAIVAPLVAVAAVVEVAVLLLRLPVGNFSVWLGMIPPPREGGRLLLPLLLSTPVALLGGAKEEEEVASAEPACRGSHADERGDSASSETWVMETSP